jgi:MoxR-like ATPase
LLVDNFNYEEQQARLRIFAENTIKAMSKTMYGMDQEIRLCLVALLTRGHVLLEGNPGMGKTALVKTFGRVLDLTYGRIQFTPDLMPSDITGTEMPDETSRALTLTFRRGPIFKTLLLADEINRASPKTQAAMLEAMAERQVTVLGQTYALPIFFTVLATENPIDQEGTYPLPEAQSDRFLFKIILNPPQIETIRSVMQKDAGKVDISQPEFKLDRPQEEPGDFKKDQETQIKLLNFYRAIRDYPLDEKMAVHKHIQIMYMVSNRQLEMVLKEPSLRNEQKEWIKANAQRFQYGLGPRATTALALASKAWSLMFPTSSTPVPEASVIAQVAPAILRHRIKLKESWNENLIYGERFLANFVCQTAPTQNGYDHVLHDYFAKLYAKPG